MTPFMTRRRRRLLIPIIHLITRIYLASRLCTNRVRPPFAFRINQGRLPVSLSLVRDFPSLATPSTKQKSYIINLLFFFFYRGSVPLARCISCTTRAVVFVLFVPIPPYVTLDFHTIRFDDGTPFFFIVLDAAFAAFSGNNAKSPLWGWCFVSRWS